MSGTSAHKDLFDGNTFCISGTLSIVRREMRDLIEKNGGRFATR
jgi:NAD-dependent DNA ligase